MDWEIDSVVGRNKPEVPTGWEPFGVSAVINAEFVKLWIRRPKQKTCPFCSIHHCAEHWVPKEENEIAEVGYYRPALTTPTEDIMGKEASDGSDVAGSIEEVNRVLHSGARIDELEAYLEGYRSRVDDLEKTVGFKRKTIIRREEQIKEIETELEVAHETIDLKNAANKSLSDEIQSERETTAILEPEKRITTASAEIGDTVLYAICRGKHYVQVDGDWVWTSRRQADKSCPMGCAVVRAKAGTIKEY